MTKYRRITHIILLIVLFNLPIYSNAAWSGLAGRILIQTEENGYARVTFYNSDRNTRIKTQIQGIGKNGNLGYTELYYGIEEIKE